MKKKKFNSSITKKKKKVKGESEDMKKSLKKVRSKLTKDSKTGASKKQALGHGFYVKDYDVKEYPHLKPVVVASNDEIVIVMRDKSILSCEITEYGLRISKTPAPNAPSTSLGGSNPLENSIFVRGHATNVIEVM